MATSLYSVPMGNKGTEDKFKEMYAYNWGKKRPIQEEQVNQKKKSQMCLAPSKE